MYKLLAILALVYCPWAVRGQTDWKFRKEEQGIRVYTAHTDSSRIKSVKVEFSVQATPDQLIAFLLDIPEQPTWIFNSKTAYIIKTLKPNDIIFYSEVTLPWPFSNRDYVAHFTVSKRSEGMYLVESHAEPEYIPAKPPLVRMPYSSAKWNITRAGDNELKIIYTFSFDPGGAVPPWLVNMFVTKGPIHTFQKLREGVRRPEYRDAHLSFLK
ncbi:START domain-containing protein [Nemorincola caseinilytica]|uniref:START domain-containing protein n=1 Tax=Nemorincola caseinilytica TaxID=2054315 RepID=A0ABP8NR37_9BACT